VYDFLLVINSNLGFSSHRYWDTATYWLKIANFPHPLSFSAFVRGDSLWIYGKALRFLKLESSGQPPVKIWWSYLAPFLTNPPVCQTDRQTDGQNCAKLLSREKIRHRRPKAKKHGVPPGPPFNTHCKQLRLLSQLQVIAV